MSQRSPPKSVFHFENTRLILVDKTSSYLELNIPKAEETHTKCIYCQKTNPHEHDIIGKVKFEPKHKLYLISLVEKKKIFPFNNIKSKKGLDIIPVEKESLNTLETPCKDVKELLDHPVNHGIKKQDEENGCYLQKKSSQHVYPVIVSNESDGKIMQFLFCFFRSLVYR